MTHTTRRFQPAPLRLMLAGLVLAVAGTVTLTANAAPPEGGRAGMHHGETGGGHGMMGGGHGMMGGRHVGHMLDAVNATPEQRAQIKQIMDSARNDLRSQRESGRTLRQQQMQLFAQPTVDARAAETLRQQMLAQHDAASKRMLQAMLDVSRVLTPEQRQKLAERSAQRRAMMERHRAEREQLAPRTR